MAPLGTPRAPRTVQSSWHRFQLFIPIPTPEAIAHATSRPELAKLAAGAIVIAEAALAFCKPLHAQIQTFWASL